MAVGNSASCKETWRKSCVMERRERHIPVRIARLSSPSLFFSSFFCFFMKIYALTPLDYHGAKQSWPRTRRSVSPYTERTYTRPAKTPNKHHFRRRRIRAEDADAPTARRRGRARLTSVDYRQTKIVDRPVRTCRVSRFKNIALLFSPKTVLFAVVY